MTEADETQRFKSNIPIAFPSGKKKNPIPCVGTALNTPRGTLWDFPAFTVRAWWLLGGLLPRHSTDWQRGVNASVTGSGTRCMCSSLVFWCIGLWGIHSHRPEPVQEVIQH